MKQRQLVGLSVVEDLCPHEGVGILQAEVEEGRLLKYLEGRHKVRAVQKGMARGYTGQIAPAAIQHDVERWRQGEDHA